jgi:hypothetical protein
MSNLFDWAESEDRKKAGMDVAANSGNENLDIARRVARRVARENNGYCDADKVGQILDDEYHIKTLGPAAGSIFRGENWVFTGEFIPSTRKSNHGRVIRVWKWES